MDTELISKVRTYLKDYRRSSDSYAHPGCALGRSVKLAEGILGRIIETNRISDKQINTLENICSAFELYIAVGEKFAEKHSQHLIELYEEKKALYEACINRDNELIAYQKAHVKRLNALLKGQTIYPYHLYGLVFGLIYLESKGMDVKDIKYKVEKLQEEYWNLFNSMKSPLSPTS